MAKFGNFKNKIKVIYETEPELFEKKVNELLEQGYCILSSSCGYKNSEEYNFCSTYQAILQNEKIFEEVGTND